MTNQDEKDTNRKLRSKSTMIKSSLCDYSDAYISEQ